MERREIMALARALALPEPVLGPLERAAEKLPEDLPVHALASPDTAKETWKAVSERVTHWRKDNGMAQLAVMLAAACHTQRMYRENGVPEEVYFATMGCLPRFLRETREITGQWVFDRGFWTWRQTGGLLFRLGTLEFEYCALGEDGPMPGKLTAGDWVLSVHIPSDAVLSREELDRSYAWAGEFFSGGCTFCQHGVPKVMLCESWLLAPALDELLPENSGIRRFAGDYVRFAIHEDDREFYRWLFGCEPPMPPEDLPERTGLQRRAKARLAAGGKIGAACGYFQRAQP